MIPVLIPRQVQMKQTLIKQDQTITKQDSDTCLNKTGKNTKARVRARKDVISVCVYCKEDGTVLMNPASDVDLVRLPCSTIYKDSWRLTVRKILGELNIEVREIFILRITKFWVPDEDFLFHIIYRVKIPLIDKKQLSLSAGGNRGMKWFSLDELQQLALLGQLASPELLEYVRQVLQPQSTYILTTDPEADKEGFDILNEVGEKSVIINTETNFLSLQEQLLRAANFTPSEQCRVYKEFLMRTFPYLLMNKYQFEDFVVELGWKKEDWPDLFFCADITGRGGMNFKEFVVFLAVTEPDTPHGTTTGEIRCQYIFRYFDKNRDNMLDRNELRSLIMIIKGNTSKAVDVEKLVDFYVQELGLGGKRRLSMNTFIKKVGELKIRGTSSIFRSGVSIWTYLDSSNDISNEKALEVPSTGSLATSASKKISAMLWRNTKSATRQENDAKKLPTKSKIVFEIATHTIKLGRGGQLEEVRPIDRVSHGKSGSMGDQDYFIRFASLQYYDDKSPANELLNALMYFTNEIISTGPKSKREDNKPAFNWGKYDMQALTSYLLQVCEKCSQILAREPRMVQIPSPVYILGDLHGNYQDLMAFEQSLWNLGLALSPCSLLFLGDYVDRGPYGVEIVSYLFAQKLKNPSKIFLIRGNHEIRSIQKSFTFYGECQRKFGESQFYEVWNMINHVFDVMPLAALVDTKIFCCHGGIPPPWMCPRIEMIDTIPCPLFAPEEESSLAWDLMWNDPVRSEQLSVSMAQEMDANEGFANNISRKTGRVFSAEALDVFLKTNGLSHVIRAHEVKLVGFQVQLGGKLLTVFSSSGYCGGPNEAACVFISQQKIRVLRINTSL